MRKIFAFIILCSIALTVVAGPGHPTPKRGGPGNKRVIYGKKDVIKTPPEKPFKAVKPVKKK